MKLSVMVVVFVWSLLSLAGCGSTGGALRATGLKCESKIDPVGIGTASPRLSWYVESDDRDQVQRAYRVLVASNPSLLARDEGDLWDSGRVRSRETAFVEYEGKSLASRDRCFWKVRSWDRDGVAGAWSDVGVWDVALLDASDWKAQWIDARPRAVGVDVHSAVYRAVDGSVRVDVTDRVRAMLAENGAVVASNVALGRDPAYGVLKELEVRYVVGGEERVEVIAENSAGSLPPKRYPYLRRRFTVERPFRRARLYVTALGVYDAWLNGELVGDQRLAPGWTDYRERVQYQVIDVTDDLRFGENMVGAMIGPGWFAGRAGLFHARAYYGDAPALLAQLEIEYADGSRSVIGTDGRWERCDGPILMADIMDGESHDARLEVEGWCDTGADGSDDWEPVSVLEEDRELYAQTDQPVRALIELPARSVREIEPGRWVFDLGQNMVGVSRLQVDEAEGTELVLRHAEMLNEDGTLYTANLRGAAAVDRYVCRGGGKEDWSPRFTFHGFRYVEVSGLTSEPDLGTVTGVVVGTDLPIVGSFSCSDERLNQLQSNIVWGMRGNMLSIPTDCPQRDERMGWTADTQVFVPTAMYNADIGAFMTKWMRDMQDAQRSDGAHADVAPVMDGLTYGTPVWGDAGTIVPWAVYWYSGDHGILAENIDSMKRWVDWCERHSTGLIRDRDRGNDYGDWLSIGADTPKDVIGTAYFARSAWIVSEACRVLGDDAGAEEYNDLFGRIRGAFIDRYVRADGSIEGDTQTCYLMALRFGLLPEDLREAAAAHLVDDLESRGWRLSTGFVGVSHLLPVLDDAGRSDVAYRLLMQDEFPSWLFSVKHGATTIWERWNGWTPEDGMNDPGMNSFNHFALGSCGEWLFAGVAGITPGVDGGFRDFEISPAIDGALTHAEASYESVYGTIRSSWSVEDDRFVLEVEVPANTRARVVIPSMDGVVHESGIDARESIGIQSFETKQGTVELAVSSGTYRFESRKREF